MIMVYRISSRCVGSTSTANQLIILEHSSSGMYGKVQSKKAGAHSQVGKGKGGVGTSNRLYSNGT